MTSLQMRALDAEKPALRSDRVQIDDGRDDTTVGHGLVPALDDEM